MRSWVFYLRRRLCTLTDNMDVITFFVHGLDFLVSKFFHSAIAVDEILIKICTFLQLARCNQAQVNNNVIRMALIIEQSVQLFERFFLVVIRGDLLNYSHELPQTWINEEMSL